MSGDAKYRDEDWLREKYMEAGLSTTQIGEVCGCAGETVRRWLEKHNIPRRSGGDDIKDQRLTDRDWLHEQYKERRKNAYEIAEECGCSSQTVYRWLQNHNIESRNRGFHELTDERLTDPGWLRQQYLEKKRNTYSIADECGCHSSTVSDWLNRHNIPSRGGIPDERLKDEDWLREEYLANERTTYDIAEECGCKNSTVSAWLQKHGIDTRQPAGKNHPRWSGGEFVYGSGWDNEKRRRVRERDDYECQDPGCEVTQSDHLNEHGEKLHVHHLRKARDVENPRERNAPENLLTLCRDCHPRWEKIAETGLVPEVKR